MNSVETLLVSVTLPEQLLVHTSLAKGCRGQEFVIYEKRKRKKSRIRETLILSTDADHRTDFFLLLFYLFYFVFFRRVENFLYVTRDM